MIWVYGKIVPDDALNISVLDRTFEHGLGLFETFRTWNGIPSLLPRHLARLTQSAEELGLPLDPASLPDAQAVAALLKADARTGDARLRITLSGGLSESHGSTLWMRSFPLPDSMPLDGAVIGAAWPARVDPLAGHKTLNYWPNRRMYEDARASGFDECVTITHDGKIWEGSISNLFVVDEDRLFTPPCEGRVLPGIMRRVVIERSERLGIDVREAPLGLFDPLFHPEEVFLTNSVRGLIPVGRWGEARFPAPGPVTQRIRDDLIAWLESGAKP